MPLPKLIRLKYCKVCGGDGCADGFELTLCWRVKSDRQAKSGAWIHTDAKSSGVPIRRFHVDPIADIDRRHAVFAALLDMLTLSGKHADQLSERRGLSDATILQNQFASVPDRFTAMQITEQLSKDYDLHHIPGFFANVRDRWQLRLYALDGFYIPLRDPQGRIQALQVRQDTDDKKRRYLMLSTPAGEFRNGASSGAPIHYAHPGRPGPAIITEGGLKGIVCAELSKYAVIGLVAVGCFSDQFGWNLRDQMPGCKGLAIAYDADQRTNDKVRMQATRLGKSLTGAGFTPRMITWPAERGNGLDDYLLAGNSI